MKIICRASNRIFVGYPLCESSFTPVFEPLSDRSIGRDPEYIALNVQFTKDVATVATVLRMVPSFFRPYVISGSFGNSEKMLTLGSGS